LFLCAQLVIINLWLYQLSSLIAVLPKHGSELPVIKHFKLCAMIIYTLFTSVKIYFSRLLLVSIPQDRIFEITLG